MVIVGVKGLLPLRIIFEELLDYLSELVLISACELRVLDEDLAA